MARRIGIGRRPRKARPAARRAVPAARGAQARKVGPMGALKSPIVRRGRGAISVPRPVKAARPARPRRKPKPRGGRRGY